MSHTPQADSRRPADLASLSSPTPIFVLIASQLRSYSQPVHHPPTGIIFASVVILFLVPAPGVDTGPAPVAADPAHIVLAPEHPERPVRCLPPLHVAPHVSRP